MIETMIICGLMAWYHVDCIQFEFYDNQKAYPLLGTPYSFVGYSTKEAGIGIIQIYDTNAKLKDACGMSILEHELQRFKQDRWDTPFCNPM